MDISTVIAQKLQDENADEQEHDKQEMDPGDKHVDKNDLLHPTRMGGRSAFH